MGKLVFSTARDKVKLTITSKSPKIPSGEQGDILPMLARVEAPPATKKHVPVDLVALLDVSATMNTEVAAGITRTDLLNKAMKFVIERLHGEDGLAILPSNEKVLTNYSTDMFRMSGQRVFAQNKVDKLVAKGDTAFGPALEQAVKILDERSDMNRVGVVMLLTDGLDSIKVTMYPIRPEVLKKYPVHTFGICVHDPNVLLSIAQKSCGTYSFVDDTELGKIADPFAVFLGGLSSIVAVDVWFQIYTNFTWRSKLKRIDCGFQSSEIIQPPAPGFSSVLIAADIRIGMLYAGEVKNFIFHIVVDPDNTSGSRPWVHTYVVYRDAPGSNYTIGEGNVGDQKTGKQAGDVGDNSRMVRAQIVQFKALEFLSTLQIEFKNQKNTAAAKGGCPKASATQKSAGSYLENKWAELMQTMDDDLIDDLDLDDLNKELKEMVKRLKQGAGMAYMCSWVSSQQQQRAATLGSVDAVGTQFFTPAMDAMLSEAKKYHVELAQGGGGGGTTQPSKLDQRKESWEKLKRQAEQMLNQPSDKALVQTWKELNAAIDKAKDADLIEAFNRGER